MKYILVQWPESQELMEHPRFNECLLVQDIEGHIEVGSSAYMCPEDLYEEVFNKMLMNKEEALKEMTTKRVSHPLLNGIWITKCMNGKYYNNLGQEVALDLILADLSPGDKLYDGWFIVEGPRDRACG